MPTEERRVKVQCPVHYVLLDKTRMVTGVHCVKKDDINQVWNNRLVNRVLVVDRPVMVQYPVHYVLQDNMSMETNVRHVSKVHFNQVWKKNRAPYVHMAVHRCQERQCVAPVVLEE